MQRPQGRQRLVRPVRRPQAVNKFQGTKTVEPLLELARELPRRLALAAAVGQGGRNAHGLQDPGAGQAQLRRQPLVAQPARQVGVVGRRLCQRRHRGQQAAQREETGRVVKQGRGQRLRQVHYPGHRRSGAEGHPL